MTDRKIRATTVDFVAYLVFVGAVILLSIEWTWSIPYPAARNIVVAERWTGDCRIVLTPQGPVRVPPELERRLNSEAFLRRVREALSPHEPVRHWDETNVHLLPVLAGSEGPLVVHVRGMMHGWRKWSIWGARHGPDPDRNEPLLADLERFLRADLAGEAPSTGDTAFPGRAAQAGKPVPQDDSDRP